MLLCPKARSDSRIRLFCLLLKKPCLQYPFISGNEYNELNMRDKNWNSLFDLESCKRNIIYKAECIGVILSMVRHFIDL